MVQSSFLFVQVLETAATSKPKQFAKNIRPGLVVDALCMLIMEPGILEADDDDMPASRIGSQVLPCFW